MSQRHGRETFYVVGDGVYESSEVPPRPASMLEETRKFRFSRMYPGAPAPVHDPKLLAKLALAMQQRPDQANRDSALPAGYTYLGQFVDHDLSFDCTKNVPLGEPVAVADLVQGRSPALDLDCLYGRGPQAEPAFYADGARLQIGRTAGSDFPPGDPVAKLDLDGYDLPRRGTGTDNAARREAAIPDPRNDENLAVAQTHVAFIRLHNRMFDRCGDFERARGETIKHYQRMLVDDFLPRFVDASVLDDVFHGKGRIYFEVPPPEQQPTPNHYAPASNDPFGTMPIEFAVAAYRFGHSMVRRAYEWNRIFNKLGAGGEATLERLLNFSGMSGTLSPGVDRPNDRNAGAFMRLPTPWIADFRRLYDFGDRLGPPDEHTPPPNFAQPIDTLLTPLLLSLPVGSISGNGSTPAAEHSLPFRNLMRGRMVRLPSGQQMAEFFGATPLSAGEIKTGREGASLEGLHADECAELTANTPLWFYLLREAEVHGRGLQLGAVGSRIVAETFHRSMEVSRHSIVRDRGWRPSLGRDQKVCMPDLLWFAYGEDPTRMTPV